MVRLPVGEVHGRRGTDQRDPPYGRAVLLHGEARRLISASIFELLGVMGYTCSRTPGGGICVDGERQQEPTTLAADIQRFVAENGRLLSGSMLVTDDDTHGVEGHGGDAAP